MSKCMCVSELVCAYVKERGILSMTDGRRPQGLVLHATKTQTVLRSQDGQVMQQLAQSVHQVQGAECVSRVQANL